MGMAVAYGRIGAHHIDVAAPGCVPHVSALTAREHDGKRFIIVSAVPALKFHCVHGHNSNRLDRLYLGIGGDRSRGTTGITRRILHLDGLVAAKTAEPRVCGRVGKGASLRRAALCGLSCAFAHAVRPRRATAWAKSREARAQFHTLRQATLPTLRPTHRGFSNSSD